MYLAVLLLVSLLSYGAQLAADPSGHWEGKLQVPEHEMAVTLELARTATGGWIGSMSIPISTSIDVPLGEILVERNSIRFRATLPGRSTWQGIVSADGTTLSGRASNGDGEAPFQLTRTGPASVKVPPPSSPLMKEFEGAWEGSLDANGSVTRIVMQLSAATDGTAVAMLTSATGAKSLEIPASTVTISGKELFLESRAVSGTYRGTLGADGTISGEWTQKAIHLPLTFKRLGAGR